MRKMTLIVGCALLLVGIVAGLALAKGPMARAKLVDAQGNEVAQAYFTAVSAQRGVVSGVNISLRVSKLPPGMHALHIHGVGQCEPPDFKSAGPHFNPHGKKHGIKNPEGAHLGDLPNIAVGADGTATVEVFAKGVIPLGEGTNSLFHPGGTSLVIHAKPDDEMTDPSGTAGDRIACGVITQQ